MADKKKDPELFQMIEAAQQRNAAPARSVLDMFIQMIMAKPQGNPTQMPQYDQEGQPAPARNIFDVLKRR